MRDLVISTKFQWIPLQIVHFPNFRYKCTTISNKEKSYKSKYLFLRFSKCNETSPKLVYFKETSGTVMHGKIQLLPMKNAKVPNQDS